MSESVNVGGFTTPSPKAPQNNEQQRKQQTKFKNSVELFIPPFFHLGFSKTVAIRTYVALKSLISVVAQSLCFARPSFILRGKNRVLDNATPSMTKQSF
eukprot:366088-Amphidinium_carterae.1